MGLPTADADQAVGSRKQGNDSGGEDNSKQMYDNAIENVRIIF